MSEPKPETPKEELTEKPAADGPTFTAGRRTIQTARDSITSEIRLQKAERENVEGMLQDMKSRLAAIDTTIDALERILEEIA